MKQCSRIYPLKHNPHHARDTSTQEAQKVNPHKQAFVVWLSVYPILTIISFVLAPILTPLAIPVRTLLMSLLMVPMMVYVIMPLATKVFAKWLRNTR
jgi:antibiotic biosynthesis monooxygenase (ABM) superfamily enzyme